MRGIPQGHRSEAHGAGSDRSEPFGVERYIPLSLGVEDVKRIADPSGVKALGGIFAPSWFEGLGGRDLANNSEETRAGVAGQCFEPVQERDEVETFVDC